MERVRAAIQRLARETDGQDLLEYGLLACLIAVVVLAGISAVTAEDVQRVAQDLIREDKLRLAVIGPFDDPDRFDQLI